MKNKEDKTGKYCPFREGHKCGDYCGLWNNGLKCCNLIGININLGVIANKKNEIKNKTL
jgi:hypothetical protein